MKPLAQTTFPFNGVNLPTSGNPPFNINNPNLKLGNIVSGLLPYLFAGAGLLLLLYLIFGGLQLMLSRGDPKAVESAKGKITGALVGFVIVFAAYWIVQIVASILGITQIKSVFGQ